MKLQLARICFQIIQEKNGEGLIRLAKLIIVVSDGHIKIHYTTLSTLYILYIFHNGKIFFFEIYN